MKKKPTNIAASIKQRLLNLSRSRNEDFAYLMERYMLERFLYRLGCCEHSKHFFLKGAMLFSIWSPIPHRATRDIDLMGTGQPDLEQLKHQIGEICGTKVEDDGLKFDHKNIEVSAIREQHLYDGLRVSLYCYLGKAKTRLQIDVGYGDKVYPRPKTSVYPAIFDDQNPPRIKAYQMETSIAEKLHAIVNLGMRNSRMKDYFDVAYLAKHFEFDLLRLSKTVQKTFARRGTKIPSALPLGLTEIFFNDRQKTLQWKAFLKKGGLPSEDSLKDIVVLISKFLLPTMLNAATKEPIEMTWRSDTGWS
jgi:predicted nucleotidyltransferase component of viral defense system